MKSNERNIQKSKNLRAEIIHVGMAAANVEVGVEGRLSLSTADNAFN